MTLHYICTTHESRLWRHCNPDLAKWHQGRIIERVTEEARAAGHEEVYLFDQEENMLAWSICGEEARRLVDGD